MSVESMPSSLPPMIEAPRAVAALPTRRWVAVTGLAAAFFVDQGEESALSLLWPAMYQALGASVGQLGLVLGVSKLATTLLLPVWGYAVDRYSRKHLLVWFTGIWGLWTLAIGWVDTLPQLLVLRVLAGLGLGVFAPAAFSLVGDLFPGEERGRAAGILRAVGLGGSGLGLAIVYNLVTESLRGAIQIDAQVGQGTVVTVAFPQVCDLETQRRST